MVATVQAASVDEERLAQLRDEVAPAVEAAVGRRLLERPPVRIETEASVTAKLTEATRDALVRQGVAEDAAVAQATAMVDAVVDDALAVYDNGTRTIYVVGDHLEGWLAGRDVPDSQLEPVCACVLAHELAHALQQQYAPLPPVLDDDTALRRRALEEGQAEVVQSLVCAGALGEAGNLLDDGSPAEPLGAAPPAADTPAFFYDYGETWVADLWRREGAEAVWAAMAAPPTYADVVARVGTLRSDPWWRTDWIGGVARQFAPDATFEEAERVSLRTLLRGLWTGRTHAGLPRSGDGMVWRGKTAAGSVLVGAWTLPDTRAAATFLTLRGRELEGMRYGGRAMLFTADTFEIGRTRIRSFGDGANAFLFEAGKGDYNEAWVLDGARLVLVVTRGQRERPRAFQDAVATALRSVPAPPAPGPAVTPAGAPGDAPPAWTWWAGKALDRANVSDHAGCATIFEKVDPAAHPRARAMLEQLAYPCAVGAGDLAAAERLVARLGGRPADAPEFVRLGHGILLRDAGRHADVLAIFEGWTPEDADCRRYVAEARIQAAMALRQWGTVAVLARDRAADPQVRGHAATELVRVGRLDAAAGVLAGTCPDMSGGARARCDAVREAISR